MDSKFFWISILIAILFTGTIFAFVLFANTSESNEKVVAKTQSLDDLQMESVGQIGTDLYAWATDDTFFNELLNQSLYKAQEDIELFLLTTSIERDLRIQIVNKEGKLVKGESFIVQVGKEEYKDLDQDGIIYITDLKSGEYSILLKEIEAYQVPKNALSVQVRAKIQYEQIDDISLLIKTEDEINAELEDTKIWSSNLASSDSQTTEIIKSDKTKIGIDVSKWNGEIDWKRVKESGVEFAIIRLGYRGSATGVLVEDPYFKRNIEGALSAGISVGVYFFTQAINEIEAVEEASMVLALCREYDITYPIFIDTEGAGGRADSLTSTDRTTICKAFMETIESGGYTSGIYASKNWYQDQLDASKFRKNQVIWLAQYSDSVTYGGTYHIWQYSSNGRISGIEGRVDLNLSYIQF